MALQGTIDTFPLADVLQLLSASSKTGRLLLDGDRGQMALWIDSGEVIGGEASMPPDSQAEVLIFEMLRFTDGEFAFDSDLGDEPTVTVEPAPLEQSLRRALELLESWVAVEAVVPSPAHLVTMAPELPEPSIQIDQSTWRLLTASGRSVAQIAEELELDEFSATSAIAELVEAGLLEVGEPTRITEMPALHLPDAHDVEAPDPTQHEDPTAELREVDEDDQVSFPDRFPIDDLIGGTDAEEDDPWSSPEMEQLEAQRFAAAQSFETVEVEPVPLGEPEDQTGGDRAESLRPEPADGDDQADDPSAETTDEVLRQMSKLSPKAAEAIAAALNSVPAGAAERGESAGEDDGPISFSGTF